MNMSCLTYEELANFLNLSPNTMKNVWKRYPHYFLTDQSQRSQSLKGARFDFTEVIAQLKALQEEKNDEINSGSKKQARSGDSVPSVLPAPGEVTQQTAKDKKRGRRVAPSRESKNNDSSDKSPKFDVFASVQ